MPHCQVIFRASLLFITCGSFLGCGYRPAYGGGRTEQLGVAPGAVLIPDATAVQAALAGARSELARAGALGDAAAFPQLQLDVLRVDELSSGISAGAGAPVARGMGLAVVVRARLVRSPEAVPELDTGDIRRTAFVDGDPDLRADSALHDATLRSAAERAGRAAAHAILGAPEPGDELL